MILETLGLIAASTAAAKALFANDRFSDGAPRSSVMPISTDDDEPVRRPFPDPTCRCSACLGHRLSECVRRAKAIRSGEYERMSRAKDEAIREAQVRAAARAAFRRAQNNELASRLRGYDDD